MAVCNLRVEVGPTRLIITMAVNRDIATAVAQPVAHFTDTKGAAAASVAKFLESFAQDS